MIAESSVRISVKINVYQCKTNIPQDRLIITLDYVITIFKKIMTVENTSFQEIVKKGMENFLFSAQIKTFLNSQ